MFNKKRTKCAVSSKNVSNLPKVSACFQPIHNTSFTAPRVNLNTLCPTPTTPVPLSSRIPSPSTPSPQSPSTKKPSTPLTPTPSTAAVRIVLNYQDEQAADGDNEEEISGNIRRLLRLEQKKVTKLNRELQETKTALATQTLLAEQMTTFKTKVEKAVSQGNIYLRERNAAANKVKALEELLKINGDDLDSCKLQLEASLKNASSLTAEHINCTFYLEAASNRSLKFEVDARDLLEDLNTAENNLNECKSDLGLNQELARSARAEVDECESNMTSSKELLHNTSAEANSLLANLEAAQTKLSNCETNLILTTENCENAEAALRAAEDNYANTVQEFDTHRIESGNAVSKCKAELTSAKEESNSAVLTFHKCKAELKTAKNLSAEYQRETSAAKDESKKCKADLRTSNEESIKFQNKMTMAKNESDKCKIELADERDRSLQTVSSLNDCTARSEALTKKNAILTSSKESLQSTLNNFQETCAETDQRLNHTSYTLSETQEGLRLCLDDKKATKLELERLKSPMQEIERINSQMGFVFDATNTNAVADAVADKRDTRLPPGSTPRTSGL